MPIINVPEADEPLEVPAEAIEVKEDEDLVLKSQDEFDDIINSRLKRKESSVQDELLGSDEFFQKAAQKRGIELREDGKPKGSVRDEELEQLRQDASRVESLEEKVTQYESQIQETRDTKLWNTVLEKSPPIRDGAEQDVKAAVKRQMTFDNEFGWVATDSDGNVKYEAGEPVGPEGVINDLSQRKDFLFRSTEMKGGPSDDPGSTGSGKKTWSESEWQAAAKQTHKMDQETFEDWDTAKEENRVR